MSNPDAQDKVWIGPAALIGHCYAIKWYALPGQIKLQRRPGLASQGGQRCWHKGTSAHAVVSVLALYFQGSL